MDRKKKVLVSSTPHIDRTHQIMRLFAMEDEQCSPITMPSQPDDLKDPQPRLLSSKPNEAKKKRAVRERKVENKEKAVPERVSAKVFKELGVEAQDLGSNALSHSRNLYNMFPQPIILDSDEEESIVAKKPLKKPRQDSKVVESSMSKNLEEKPKLRVPGGSRTSRLTRLTAGRKPKKQSPIRLISGASSTSSPPRNKPAAKSKMTVDNKGSPSIMILDDDDENSFPVYQPGSSIFQSSRIRRKEKDRFSFELDEKFPLVWKSKPKTHTHCGETVAEKVAKGEIEEVFECEDTETNNNSVETMERNKVSKYLVMSQEENLKKIEQKHTDENVGIKDVSNEGNKKGETCKKEVVKKGNKKETVSNKRKHRVLGKFEGSLDSQLKYSDKENTGKVSEIKKEKENPVLISHFEDIIFKPRKTNEGGIVARCLKTDQNDIGYLHVPANEVFSGNKTNITFVLIEGDAIVLHLGEQHTMSHGDMIHITDGSGYKISASESSLVKFLYIKALT